jgi:hypothetical protein
MSNFTYGAASVSNLTYIFFMGHPPIPVVLQKRKAKENWREKKAKITSKTDPVLPCHHRHSARPAAGCPAPCLRIFPARRRRIGSNPLAAVTATLLWVRGDGAPGGGGAGPAERGGGLGAGGVPVIRRLPCAPLLRRLLPHRPLLPRRLRLRGSSGKK